MKKSKAVFASVLTIGLVASLAACGGSNNSSSSNGPVTLRIQTFNNPGFAKATSERPGADLFAKYEKEHPNVKIEETAAASSNDARAAFNTAISTGSNAYDVYLVEVDWMPSIMAMPDKFVDLSSYTQGNDWLDWAKENATANGKLVGAATDIGPEAVCYRSDLLDKAGIPSDPKSVADWIGGENASWDSYFKAGQEYHQKTNLPFYDTMGTEWHSMINQVQYSYLNKDNEIIATTNPKIKEMYDQLMATQDMSAHLSQWSDDWNAAFKADDGFATVLCPAWLLNNIKGNAGDNFKNWRVADAFPNKGSNWGGSYLVVPEASANKDEAAKFAAWLTAPEQQTAVFEAASNYPSSVKAENSKAVQTKKDAYFGDEETGKIFGNRAQAIDVVPYKGGAYFDIQTKMDDALNRVDVTHEQTPAQAWKQWVEDVKSLS
ncbi:ABC transporter substrate-binding protein [Bifidobacterium dolichotidis]|nr:extracellular solute-binding protein [Bifidobacterium dolichotidis]